MEIKNSRRTFVSPKQLSGGAKKLKEMTGFVFLAISKETDDAYFASIPGNAVLKQGFWIPKSLITDEDRTDHTPDSACGKAGFLITITGHVPIDFINQKVSCLFDDRKNYGPASHYFID